MKKLLILILFASCSSSYECNCYESYFAGFMWDHTEFGNAEYVEVDVNGKTIVSKVFYVPHGIKSEPFTLPNGWSEVTRVEVFDKEGNRTHFSFPIDSINGRGGQITTGVPFKIKGGAVTQMMFSK